MYCTCMHANDNRQYLGIWLVGCRCPLCLPVYHHVRICVPSLPPFLPPSLPLPLPPFLSFNPTSLLPTYNPLFLPPFPSTHFSRYRAMYDLITMPWDWPVEVNYHEAKAFCHWKGEEYRLPTEAEYTRMRCDPVSARTLVQCKVSMYSIQ